VHPDIIKFLHEAPASRRAAIAMEIVALRDHHDDLLADHARMIHANDTHAKTITQALSKTLIQLDALGWQLREEENALKTLIEGSRKLNAAPRRICT
jgi:hypothetical protein